MLRCQGASTFSIRLSEETIMRSFWAMGLCVMLCAVVRPVWAQPGAPSPAAVDDKAIIKAAEFAIAAQLKTMKSGEKLALVKILGAQKQVVSGMNYNLTLQVKHGDKVRTANAQVWEQAWQKEPYKLTSWKFADEKAEPEKKPTTGKKSDAPAKEKTPSQEKSKNPPPASKSTGKSKEPKR
jgi:hypothetical protein